MRMWLNSQSLGYRVSWINFTKQNGKGAPLQLFFGACNDTNSTKWLSAVFWVVPYLIPSKVESNGNVSQQKTQQLTVPFHHRGLIDCNPALRPMRMTFGALASLRWERMNEAKRDPLSQRDDREKGEELEAIPKSCGHLSLNVPNRSSTKFTCQIPRYVTASSYYLASLVRPVMDMAWHGWTDTSQKLPLYLRPARDHQRWLAPFQRWECVSSPLHVERVVGSNGQVKDLPETLKFTFTIPDITDIYDEIKLISYSMSESNRI